MKVRAVLDTSVLLDADRHELLFLAKQRLYTIVWSAFIIGELVRVRTELSLTRGLDSVVHRSRINEYIAEISRVAMLVNYTRLQDGNYHEWLRDPDDEPVLATALVGKARNVVSWNERDFPPLGKYAGVEYLTPPQFVAELYRQHPERDWDGVFKASGYRVP